jgi:hypothetical protein
MPKANCYRPNHSGQIYQNKLRSISLDYCSILNTNQYVAMLLIKHHCARYYTHKQLKQDHIITEYRCTLPTDLGTSAVRPI